MCTIAMTLKRFLLLFVFRLLFRQLNKSHDEPAAVQSQTNVQTDQPVQHCTSGDITSQQEEAQGGQCHMDVECTDKQRDPTEGASTVGNDAQASGQDVCPMSVQTTVADKETGQCWGGGVQQMEEDHPRTVLEEPMFPSHPFKIFPDEEVVPRESSVPPKRRRSDDEVAMVTREAGQQRLLAYLYEKAYALGDSTAPPQVNRARQDGRSGDWQQGK